MDEKRLWGLLGVLLAVAGVVVIAPEVAHGIGGEGLGAMMLTVYGVGVFLAALVTVLVVGPSVVRGA
ncbi:MAG: hypothetical protein ABEH47_08730 [Haloferacaceae archaeon]